MGGPNANFYRNPSNMIFQGGLDPLSPPLELHMTFTVFDTTTFSVASNFFPILARSLFPRLLDKALHIFLLVQSYNVPFSFVEHCSPKTLLQGSTPIFCLLLIYTLELEACIPSKELVQIFPVNEGKTRWNGLYPRT